MREKYESLSASVLRELAKSRGIKGTSTMKKAQLVEAMLALDESEAESKKAEEAVKPKTAAKAESEKTEKTERTTSVHHSRGSAEAEESIEASIMKMCAQNMVRKTQKHLYWKNRETAPVS